MQRKEVGGRPHLHQCLLHGGPVGHSPCTLQDKVRVYVTFGLAIFRQGFPLVQFLRAPRRQGSRKQKLSYQQPTDSGRVGDRHLFPFHRKAPQRRMGFYGVPGLILCALHLPSRCNCSPGTPRTIQPTTQPSRRSGKAGVIY